MDLFKEILFNENRDFNCDICNKYLSIAPILFHESVGKVCGRCFERGETNKYPDVTFETQTIYEKIARHIIYPCSFQAKGCNAKLEWDQVSDHEDSCNFKENKCPFGQDVIMFKGKKCDWIGDSKSLICHLKETHSEYCSDLIKMTLRVHNTRSNILISDFMDIPVVAVIYIPDEELSTIYFHVFMETVAQFDAHIYDLEVSDEKGKHKMVFPENKIYPLCERVFTANGLKYGFNLDREGLQALLRSDNLNFWFKIKSRQSCLLEDQQLGITAKQHNIFKHKCEACKNILIDIIYVCNGGHNVCKDCYNDDSYCKCEQRRNNFLENLSEMSLYECKNKDQGCSELVLHQNFKFHEQNCKLTPKKCVMDCGWLGNNADMLNHLRELHSEMNLNEDNVFTFNQETQNFFTVFNGIIFVISISCDSRCDVTVRVQYIDHKPSIYRFEFFIITGKLKLRCSQYCQRLVYGDDRTQSLSINYPVAFLRQFLLDQSKFNFQVNIFS